MAYGQLEGAVQTSGVTASLTVIVSAFVLGVTVSSPVAVRACTMEGGGAAENSIRHAAALVPKSPLACARRKSPVQVCAVAKAMSWSMFQPRRKV